MVVIGLSPIAHESAVGIIVNGKLVAAASEERFSRVKNQAGFPHRALEYVMKQAGVNASEVDHVAYAALPISEERLRDLSAFATNVAYVALGSDTAAHKLRHLANYGRSLLLRSEWLPYTSGQHEILTALKGYGLGEKLVYVDHHRAHCASAYYTSGFDRCLAVSLDGYGSGQAGSFYLCEGGRLTCLAPIPYPHSLGTFYRRVTQALGFKPNRHEGKIVGLAAFGDPSILEEEIFQRFDFSHGDYFRFKSGQDPYFERTLVNKYRREDIAAAYQRVLERVAVEYVTRWVKRTGVRHVACAGGVFANVKMNQRILEIPEVEQVFIFPAMGDNGVGVGAGLALTADLEGLEPARLDHVYLGPSYTESELEKTLASSQLPYHRAACVEQEIAEHLFRNKVVARFDGAMEFGPRSLGNRSILYPATEPSVNKWLNERLNRTEFMPFAPITLAEHADSLYQNIGGARYAAEFMTITADCTELMKRQSPAAVHVDGTARPQLLRQPTNPSLYDVLTRYHALSGIPTLINTSYNMHEEPIVCSPADALRAFQDGRLEVLALGPFVLESAA
ncbi:MAG: carbamoyltransferase C-terminal domain-containing protein [Polyangiaceae bacterium]|nr:carbamoyltransferase C-terminal domain-containing protein [Polyangiaceae bacterium]